LQSEEQDWWNLEASGAWLALAIIEPAMDARPVQKDVHMIIHAAELPEAPQEGRPLVLKRVINAEEHTARLSLTWVRIWGHHERVVNATCDRAYYVITGSGRFQVGDGAPMEPVSAGDAVFVPAGTPYEFNGDMTYIVTNGPAFTAGSDHVLPAAFPA